MTRWSPKRDVGEAGITLVELMVALMITALLGTVVATWMTSATRAVTLHRDDDRAVQDLRQTKDLFTRELRMASSIEVTSATSITFWVDLDFDGEKDDGETITWFFEGDGTLVRSTDLSGDSRVVLDHVVVAESGFTYDAVAAADVRKVSVILVVTAGSADRTRSLSTQIFVRNAG